MEQSSCAAPALLGAPIGDHETGRQAETRMVELPRNLHDFERKIFSQFGEDGVLERIFNALGITSGQFLEIGIGPPWGQPLSAGLEGNCVLLHRKGWTGTWIDGSDYPPEFNCQKYFVTALNINDLFSVFDIPLSLDCMSIDTDGQEYWIWAALDITPKVMILEYNGALDIDCSVTMRLDPAHVWDGTRYHGASLRALDSLARRKNYVLVWCNGVNAVFVRKDLVSNPHDFTFSQIFRSYPPHRPDPLGRPWLTV